MWRISAVPDRGRGSVLPPFNSPPPLHSAPPAPPLAPGSGEGPMPILPSLPSCPSRPSSRGPPGRILRGWCHRRRAAAAATSAAAAATPGRGRCRTPPGCRPACHGALRPQAETTYGMLGTYGPARQARKAAHARPRRQRKARNAEKAQAGTRTGVPVAGRRQNGQAVQATGIRRLCPPFIKECGGGCRARRHSGQKTRR